MKKTIHEINTYNHDQRLSEVLKAQAAGGEIIHGGVSDIILRTPDRQTAWIIYKEF